MMNRDMLKLRKDPTIPPSSATVTTSNTNAFSVSPRLGGSNADSRRSGGRQRSSPKGSGPVQSLSPSPVPGSSGSVAGSTAALMATVAAAGSQVSAVTVSNMMGSGPTSASGGGAATSVFSSGGSHPRSSRQMGSPTRSNKRPLNNRSNTFKFDTNGTLWALSASPDFSMVAVVGRDVLKILSVTESGAEESVNLKTVGIRNNFAGSMDVKWGPTTGRDAKIATIGTNGPIVIWDVGTQNKIDRTIKEHTRAVNRICFSPQEPNLLLSGSQDGTVRLWDLRTRDRPGQVMEAKDIVREVQFNPVSMHDIVAGYESGNIQRWDLRNLSTSEKKFMGHMGFVTSLDYHPSGRFLASGGRDRTIKVWDMEDEKRRELHNIPTIQYTSKVQWRPNKPYHLAACFKDEATVQIFDVRRPYVPIHVLTQHDKDATSILWKDTDVLWTVSKDKTFSSTLIRGLPQSADLLSAGKAAMNCYGQLAFTLSTKGGLDSFEKDLVPKPGRANAKSVALDGSSEAMIYRTRQTGGIFDCEMFNHEAFIYCAQNYSTEAGSVRDACEHNANIAWQANKYRDSQTWMAIKLFYSDMAESAIVLSQAETVVADPKAISSRKGDALKGEDDDDSDDSVRPPSKPNMPSLFAIKVSDEPIRRDWSHQEQVRAMLENYAEQGDVQMCVTILLVLAKEKGVPVFSRSQQWFGSYIDLLSRFKLWSIATAVAQACDDPGIHSMNQDSTTIHTSCSSCMKPLTTGAPDSSGFWACDRCRKVLSSCSICHKTVRGIFTWCTHCSHGFHLQHAQEWFSQSAECPTGCGHQCFPEMLKIQQEQEEQQQQLQQQHQQHQPTASETLHTHHQSGSVHNGHRLLEEAKDGSPIPYMVAGAT